MTDLHAKTPPLSVPSDALSNTTRRRIFVYLGVLIVLLAFGSPAGGLIDIPVSFFLKNKLHLAAHEVAQFRLVAAIPLYLAFVFGFIRDTWNPFGMRDRGYMLLFSGLTAGLYVSFAFNPVSYASLLAAMVLLTTSYLFRFQRSARADLGDRTAECDVRPDQRSMEHCRLDPWHCRASHRRGFEQRAGAARQR